MRLPRLFFAFIVGSIAEVTLSQDEGDVPISSMPYSQLMFALPRTWLIAVEKKKARRIQTAFCNTSF
jgi:hypothetical protein